MESCLAVEREQEKVLKKLKTLSGSASDKLQKIIDQVNVLKEQLSAGTLLLLSFYSDNYVMIQGVKVVYECEGLTIYTPYGRHTVVLSDGRKRRYRSSYRRVNYAAICFI